MQVTVEVLMYREHISTYWDNIFPFVILSRAFCPSQTVESSQNRAANV